MKYEIDFLPIGKSMCGDSFVLRFGYFGTGDPKDQTVILIDGGFTDDWETIKSHIEKWYGHSKIDLVISTHPDQDHINGLSGVLENMTVGQLWMHLPWLHSQILEESRSLNFNMDRLSPKLAKSLSKSVTLEETAEANNIPVSEPFAAETELVTGHGTVRVVGPSKDFYESLLPQFLDWKGKQQSSVTRSSSLEKILSGLSNFAEEAFHIELLNDKGQTSPQNNSSTIILIEHSGSKFLFTGDAGIEAIELACQELEFLGHEAGSYKVVQIPHHGSRQNVGPTVLNRLLGDKLSDRSVERGHAYVSAAKDCSDHPKKIVMNAFTRRGYPVVSTEGSGKVFHNLGEQRPGWSYSEPHPLYTEVEAED